MNFWKKKDCVSGKGEVTYKHSSVATIFITSSLFFTDKCTIKAIRMVVLLKNVAYIRNITIHVI